MIQLHTKTFVYLCLSFRINLDSIQAEASALLNRLKEASKKVSNSVDDVKQQFTEVFEV